MSFGFGDFMGLVTAMGGLVGIVALFGQAYGRRLAHKERIAALRLGAEQKLPSTEQAQLVAKLEHRIRVLERIATDKTTTLAAQIEDLREPAN